MAFETHDLGDNVRVGTFRTRRGDNGELVVIPTPFRNAVTQVAIDPSDVFLSIRTPGGVTTEMQFGQPGSTIIRDGVGMYHADINANAKGMWHYCWSSTGTGQAAEERSFRVRPRQAT